MYTLQEVVEHTIDYVELECSNDGQYFHHKNSTNERKG